MRIFSALVVGAICAANFSATAQTITVDHPWARATAPSQSNGGVFLTLTDSGAADALVGAESPVAATVELHQTVADNGVMKMLPIAQLLLEPGKPVALVPGGYHLMVLGLKHQLNQGETFPITLKFAHATPQTVTVTIGAAGAGGPGMEHSHMDHMHMDMSK